MTENNRVFVDANYLIALFNPNDTLYPQTVAIGKRLEAGRVFLVISNFIFLETVSVLSQRRGRKVSVDAGNYLRNHLFCQIVHIDTSLGERTWEIFKNTAHKNISFVDCSTIAVMQAESIRRLLTFDITDFKRLQKVYPFSFYALNGTRT